MIGLGPSVGSLVGGGMGGVLAEPAEKYPMLNTPFFRNNPYALPVFAAGAVNFISWVLGYFYLPETLRSKIIMNDELLLNKPCSTTSATEASETDPLLTKVNGAEQMQPLRHSMMKTLTSSIVLKPLSLTFLGSFCHASYLTIIPL